MDKSMKYALINAAIMGAAVFIGAFSDGHITPVSALAALSAALGTFLANVKQFFDNVQNKKAQIQPGFLIFYGANTGKKRN